MCLRNGLESRSSWRRSNHFLLKTSFLTWNNFWSTWDTIRIFSEWLVLLEYFWFSVKNIYSIWRPKSKMAAKVMKNAFPITCNCCTNYLHIFLIVNLKILKLINIIDLAIIFYWKISKWRHNLKWPPKQLKVYINRNKECSLLNSLQIFTMDIEYQCKVYKYVNNILF